MLHKHLFWIKHILRKLTVKLCFSKKCCVVTLLFMIIYESAYSYCIWGIAWFVSMEKTSILIKFLRMNFMDLLHYLQKYKDALSWSMLFGKLTQNLFYKKWVEGFENLVNILGIQIFYETTWKWIMYFELKVICEIFMFYPWAVTCD